MLFGRLQGACWFKRWGIGSMNVDSDQSPMSSMAKYYGIRFLEMGPMNVLYAWSLKQSVMERIIGLWSLVVGSGQHVRPFLQGTSSTCQLSPAQKHCVSSFFDLTESRLRLQEFEGCLFEPMMLTRLPSPVDWEVDWHPQSCFKIDTSATCMFAYVHVCMLLTTHHLLLTIDFLLLLMCAYVHVCLWCSYVLVRVCACVHREAPRKRMFTTKNINRAEYTTNRDNQRQSIVPYCRLLF